MHDFFREVDCTYKGEQYSVRDNGAVLRHPPPNKRARPCDGYWTFGTPDSNHGYMCIASVRIHRIVATAFHGAPPTPEHVIDHIDTNRRNNRPENLRWLTRLENVLKNPITLKRIMLCYGSIEAFLAAPSKPRYGKLERNFEWMRTVSPQEAQAAIERLNIWAKSDKAPSGGSLGEWLFQPITTHAKTSEVLTPRPALVMAQTPGAAQRKWRIPSEFPCCPQATDERTIAAYAEKLNAGVTFARNSLSESVVLESAMNSEQQSIWVMCEQAREEPVKPWLLAQVTLEDGLYIHTSLGSFFTKEGAEKNFCLAQGLEWTGGDSIDDFC